jgi:hypothetical protein
MPIPTPTPVPEHAAVQRIKAFHETVNAIEVGGNQKDTIIRLLKEHTTISDPLTPMSLGLLEPSPLTIAMSSGLVRFSKMKYELISGSAECAVVRASGDMALASENNVFDEKYVVVRQGEKWLIRLDIKSCN